MVPEQEQYAKFIAYYGEGYRSGTLCAPLCADFLFISKTGMYLHCSLIASFNPQSKKCFIMMEFIKRGLMNDKARKDFYISCMQKILDLFDFCTLRY